MRPSLKTALVTLALFGAAPFGQHAVAAPGAAQAPVKAEANEPARQAVSPADARAIRAVVQAQLDAFAADDAHRAFALAAPKIREMFGDADTFIGMVRSGYPVVYRPASTEFMVPQRAGSEIILGVRMTDGRGTLWLATYVLQRQPDNSWRIAGCDVSEIQGHVT